jgi:hypothetical protein
MVAVLLRIVDRRDILSRPRAARAARDSIVSIEGRAAAHKTA